MRQDDEPSPLLKIVSDGGGAFGLSDALYVRWWKSLPEEDRATFARLGGDDLLGRFVCGYDLLSTLESENTQTVVNAFALATGLHPDHYETKARANRAWEHAATRELLDRLQSREFSRAERRVLRATSALVEDTIEKALQTDRLDDRKSAIGAALSFLRYGTEERKMRREIRALLENEQLKAALHQTKKELNAQGELTALTDDDARRYVLAIASKVGKEKVREIIEGDAS